MTHAPTARGVASSASVERLGASGSGRCPARGRPPARRRSAAGPSSTSASIVVEWALRCTTTSLAVVRQRQAGRQVALRGAVDQEPRAPRPPRVGRQPLGLFEGRRLGAEVDAVGQRGDVEAERLLAERLEQPASAPGAALVSGHVQPGRLARGVLAQRIQVGACCSCGGLAPPSSRSRRLRSRARLSPALTSVPCRESEVCEHWVFLPLPLSRHADVATVGGLHERAARRRVNTPGPAPSRSASMPADCRSAWRATRGGPVESDAARSAPRRRRRDADPDGQSATRARAPAGRARAGGASSAPPATTAREDPRARCGRFSNTSPCPRRRGPRGTSARACSRMHATGAARVHAPPRRADWAARRRRYAPRDEGSRAAGLAALPESPAARAWRRARIAAAQEIERFR